MTFLASPMALVYFVGFVAIVSLVISPRKITVAGFFDGASGNGVQPGLWTGQSHE